METEYGCSTDSFGCKECQAEHDMPYDYCCLLECGQHEWCKYCNQ